MHERRAHPSRRIIMSNAYMYGAGDVIKKNYGISLNYSNAGNFVKMTINGKSFNNIDDFYEYLDQALKPFDNKRASVDISLVTKDGKMYTFSLTETGNGPFLSLQKKDSLEYKFNNLIDQLNRTKNKKLNAAQIKEILHLGNNRAKSGELNISSADELNNAIYTLDILNYLPIESIELKNGKLQINFNPKNATIQLKFAGLTAGTISFASPLTIDIAQKKDGYELSNFNNISINISDSGKWVLKRFGNDTDYSNIKGAKVYIANKKGNVLDGKNDYILVNYAKSNGTRTTAMIYSGTDGQFYSNEATYKM